MLEIIGICPCSVIRVPCSSEFFNTLPTATLSGQPAGSTTGSTRVKRRTSIACLIGLAMLLMARAGSACVGAACLQIWSTAQGSGALTVEWDPRTEIQTYESFCSPDRSQCLYSAIDPGFMAPRIDATPTDSYFVLEDGTAVTVVLISADPGVTMTINGRKLSQAGESALLGTMPNIHNHPSWQIIVPGGQFGDFRIHYRLTTTSLDYSESEALQLIVTNMPQVAPTPTPSPTVTPEPCAGDCNGDDEVTIDELIVGVNMGLGILPADTCPACDSSGDGEVTIDEIVAAVNAALDGCHPIVPVSFAEIQDGIFTPSCATQFCHDMQGRNGNLDLTAGAAYDELVNVEPDTFSAYNAGLLRVDPLRPDNSFLLIKLTGPPPDQGSLMPLVGGPLSPDKIDQVRNWILQGAPR